MLIPVKVYQMVLDQSMSPVILLVDHEQKLVLPIWIGPFEAQAIVLAMEGVTTPRPMTHDLMNEICQQLEAKITRVVVTGLKDGTYFAEICLSRDQQELHIDARPSDAIALALRASADLYMTDQVAGVALAFEELVSKTQEKSSDKGPVNVINLEDYRKKLH